MTYVGRGIDAISNVEKLDNITFDGSTTYNLTKSSVAFTPSGKNNILVSINGVVQQGNFTVAGATIIFDFSPSSNDTCNFIMHYGTGVLNVPADDTVKTATVQDDAITTDKLANSINSAITANTAKTTNATHSGEVTGATALTIADNIVDEANLKVSNSAVNGYMLTAQSGASGGLTWASAPSSGLVLLHNERGTNDSTKTINSIFSDTYDRYLIELSCKPADNDKDLEMQFVSSNGTASTTGYYGAVLGYTQAGNEDRGNHPGLGHMALRGVDGNSNGRFQHLRILVNGIHVGHANYGGIMFQSRGFDGANNFEYHTGGYFHTVSSDRTGIKFSYNTGNISSYSIQVYGINGTQAIA